MENASYIGLSLQSALRRQLDVTANNVANASTSGYKAQRVLFADYIVKPDGDAALDDPVAMVVDRGTVQDFRPGSLTATGNTLDLAIEGDGWVAVEGPAGPRYGRAGALQVNAEGLLVDRNGLAVLDEAGTPIQLPANTADIAIDGQGTVTAGGQAIGRIGLWRFETPELMQPVIGGLFTSNEEPVPAEGATLRQGFIEGSNVEPIVEISRMIEIQRLYASTQRMLEGEHERIRDAVRSLGSLT